VPLPGDNDPYRCVAWAFAEFPVIPGAKGYELTVANTRNGTRQTYSGKPFPDDHWDDYPAHFDVHKGFHWFALSGYSTGAGCADAILAFEGAYKIVRSRVSLEQAFERQLRPPPSGWKIQRCHGRGEAPKVGKPGQLLLVTRIGAYGSTIKSKGQPRSKIALHAFMDEESILETDGQSALEIMVEDSPEHFTSDGGVVIGPGMRVRIEPGKRIEVLDRDPDASWDDVPMIKAAPQGRGINIGCMSARG
jgi:hypothetical protein